MKSRIGLLFVLSIQFISLLFFYTNCGQAGFKIQDLESKAPPVQLSILNDFKIENFEITQRPLDLSNLKQASAKFRYNGVLDPRIHFACQIDGEEAFGCDSYSVELASILDGAHSLKIYLKYDQELRLLTDLGFQIDSTKPIVTMNSRPASITPDRNYLFSFKATDNLSGVRSIECALGTSAFVDCAKDQQFGGNGLVEGDYVFKIKVVDKAGNIFLESYPWTVQYDHASVKISKSPVALTKSRDSLFEFAGINQNAAYSYLTECKIDKESFGTCSGSKTYSQVLEGNHTFSVQIKNSINGVVLATDEASWTVDYTPPDAPVVTVDTMNLRTKKEVKFYFSSSDATSGIKGFKCHVDSLVDDVCKDGQYTMSDAKDGTHSFTVKATDNLDQDSQATTTDFSVDTTPPDIIVVNKPTTVSDQNQSPVFTFDISDASGIMPGSVNCRLGTVTCPMPAPQEAYPYQYTFNNIGTGTKNITITATDLSFNSRSYSMTWTIADSAPQAIPTPLVSYSPMPGGPRPTSLYSKIDLSETHGCALNQNKDLLCWGDNEFFQLGIRTKTSIETLTRTNSRNVSDFSVGKSVTCTIENGKIFCIGNLGQLGLDYTEPMRGIKIPLDGVNTATSLSLDSIGNALCFIEFGQVKCLGVNSNGHLGQGASSASSKLPLIVSLPENSKAISMAALTCALSDAGNVYCWGLGHFNNDSILVVSSLPVKISGFAHIKSLKTSGSGVCGLSETGSVTCWGVNFTGNSYNTPTVVVTPGAQPVLDFAFFANTPLPLLCVNLDMFGVQCIGDNSRGGIAGQLPQYYESFVPLYGPFLRNLRSMVIKDQTNCAIDEMENIECWGDNSHGRAGRSLVNGIGLEYETPNMILNDPKLVAFGASGFTCAALKDNSLKCWGLGFNGMGPMAPPPVHIPSASNVKALSAETSRACYVNTAGSVYCFNNTNGSNTVAANYSYTFSTPLPIAGIVNGSDIATDIVSGLRHTCVLTSAGRVLCFGDNTYGQVAPLDLSTSINAPTSVALFGKKALKLVAGQNHSCALLEDKTVSCWGNSLAGILGQTQPYVGFRGPSLAVGLNGIKSLFAGGDSVCTILETNDIHCWGQNYWNASATQLISPLPTKITNFLHVPESMLLSKTGICSQFRGKLYCLGDSKLNGLGFNMDPSLTPDLNLVFNQFFPVPNLSNVIQAFGSNENNRCAIVGVGQSSYLKCWGLNTYLRGDPGGGLFAPQLILMQPWILKNPL